MNPILSNLLTNLMFGGNPDNYVPGPYLYIGLLDAAQVEIPSVARVQYACNQFNWFDTRGGVDALSTGDKKVTANTSSIRFGQPTTNYTPYHVGVFTAPTGGDLLFLATFNNTYSVLSTDNFGPQIYGNDLTLAFYDMLSYGTPPTFGLSAYASSRIIDFLLRGNPGNFVFPTTYELALMLDERGTEVSSNGTGYSRVTISAPTNITLQGNGVTTNGDLAFPPVLQNWGNIKAMRLYDTSGNVWFETILTAPVRVEFGDEPPYFPDGTGVIVL